jgi:uncharacterized membrane protein
VGSQSGGSEAGMAQERLATKRNGWMIAGLWFSGVVLFVMELNAGLVYVQERVSTAAHSSLGFFPALVMALLKFLNTALWHYGQLEAGFRILPLATLPFLLLGLAIWMGRKVSWHRQESTEE